jgi:hypothetical protein
MFGLVDGHSRPTYGATNEGVASVAPTMSSVRRDPVGLGPATTEECGMHVSARGRRFACYLGALIVAAVLAFPISAASTAQETSNVGASTSTAVFSFKDVGWLALGSVIAVGVGVAVQRAVREPS